MVDHSLKFDANLAKLTPQEWEEQLDDIAEEHGYFQSLGIDHKALFLDAGPNLLVTFENAEKVRGQNPKAAPIGFRFAQQEGWSVLSIISQNESWFRHPMVYGYFDRLIDDGFLEDFDNVLFYGAQAGGYAATAYSVTSPGAHVLALQPQATLDPKIVGFDSRFTSERRHDFRSRYGYAPDMIDAANRAYIAFDPLQRMDAIHAALFTRKNVEPLRATHLGPRLDVTLNAMGALDNMLRQAMYGTLSTASFSKLMRARRNQPVFLRALHHRLLQTGHPMLAVNVCEYALRQGKNPYFETKLAELKAKGYAPIRHTAAE